MGADPRGARELGQRGERLAADYLRRRGFRVLGAGFLARRGSDAFGSPSESVGMRKRRALNAAAAEYRALAGWRGPIDFAVVAIGESGDPELIEDPF
jgi:Holliday junction resolvase-like predicted endonuclease